MRACRHAVCVANGHTVRLSEWSSAPSVTEGYDIRMTPSHPGHFVRVEVIDVLGLNVTKAAAILGVRRATLSALLNGRSGMSAEMALRVEKAFGVSMDMLLRMQAWYDASQMRARAREIAVEPYQPA